MKQTKVANIPLCKFGIFEKYPELIALVTTRTGGVSKGSYSEFNLAFHVLDKNSNVIRNREILANALEISPNDFTCPMQTQGTNIHIVLEDEKGRGSNSWEDGFPDTDSLVTNVNNIPIAVVTADCAGVFLYDPTNRVIGIVHSGRTGTEGEIVTKTINKMHDQYRTCTENLIVGLGPCIHNCCYDIDIPSLINTQLLELGVRPENIEISDLCTSCNNHIFYSYRADGGRTGRFINLIMLRS